MKVKVISKTESVIYKCEVYKFDEEFEMDEAIAEGLIQRGYVKAVTDEVDEEELSEMSYKEVQKLAKEKGIDASGKKEEIIKRILEQEDVIPFSDLEDGDEEGDELPNTGMPE